MTIRKPSRYKLLLQAREDAERAFSKEQSEANYCRLQDICMDLMDAVPSGMDRLEMLLDPYPHSEIKVAKGGGRQWDSRHTSNIPRKHLSGFSWRRRTDQRKSSR